MDIGKSFTFVFEDDEWINKVVVGGLFTLATAILVGIPFLVGYFVQLVRNVMQGIEKPLPAWDNLGDKFREGLLLSVIYILWGIPVWVISCITAATSAMTSSQSDTAVAFASFLTICLSCLSGLWGLVMALALPAITIRFAQNPEFKSGFEFSEIWQFTKDNIGNVIIAVLLAVVASLLSSLGVILCVIGVFLTMFWAYAVESHLIGQVYLNRKDNAVDVLPIQ